MQVEKRKHRYTIVNLTILLETLVEENFDWNKYYLVNLHDEMVCPLEDVETRALIEEIKTGVSFVVRDDIE